MTYVGGWRAELPSSALRCEIIICAMYQRDATWPLLPNSMTAAVSTIGNSLSI